MKPYYEHDGITIYHGDCLDILPELDQFDLLLTDPPYGIGWASNKTKGCSVLAPLKKYEISDWDDNPISDELILECISKAKYSSIFGGNYYKLPPARCWLVWDKQNGKNNFADCELAWTNYGTSVRIIRHLWHGMIRKGNEKRYHPTQKPLQVMKFVISKCPIDAKTILDTFAGSGTTLLAAKDLGIKAVGIEKEEKYCEIAAKRLSQEILSFDFRRANDE